MHGPPIKQERPGFYLGAFCAYSYACWAGHVLQSRAGSRTAMTLTYSIRWEAGMKAKLIACAAGQSFRLLMQVGRSFSCSRTPVIIYTGQSISCCCSIVSASACLQRRCYREDLETIHQLDIAEKQHCSNGRHDCLIQCYLGHNGLCAVHTLVSAAEPTPHSLLATFSVHGPRRRSKDHIAHLFGAMG